MGKFKYEQYDYTKICIKKETIHFQRVFGRTHYEALGRLFNDNGENLINRMVSELKKHYVSEINLSKKSDYQIDDFDWEWTLITPGRVYKSNETGCKKE